MIATKFSVLLLAVLFLVSPMRLLCFLKLCLYVHLCCKIYTVQARKFSVLLLAVLSPASAFSWFLSLCQPNIPICFNAKTAKNSYVTCYFEGAKKMSYAHFWQRQTHNAINEVLCLDSCRRVSCFSNTLAFQFMPT